MPQRYEEYREELEVSTPAPHDEFAVSDAAGDIYGPSTVIAALDQIELLVEGARAVPLSANIVLNKAEILDLVGQAREALPEDLVAADAVVADADAVLNRADNVAEAAVAEATAKSRTLLDEARDKADTVLAETADEAARKVERANEEAQQTRTRAQQEAEAILDDARAQVERMVSTDHITEMAQQHGIDIVQKAKREAAALRKGAQDYVSNSLGQTATLLEELLRRTEGGIKALADREEVDEPANIDLD